MPDCFEIKIILSPKGLSWVGVTKPAQELRTNIQITSTVAGQEQAVGIPPVLGLAFAAAENAGLPESSKELFINFMAARFPEQASIAYVEEWADRFKRGVATMHCDSASHEALCTIRETLEGRRKMFPKVK